MYILSTVDVAKAKRKKKECPNGTHIILAFQNELFNYKQEIFFLQIIDLFDDEIRRI